MKAIKIKNRNILAFFYIPSNTKHTKAVRLFLIAYDAPFLFSGVYYGIRETRTNL